MYRLIALDLDDTLLGTDGAISPENHFAIAEARSRGCAVTLVTARSWRATRTFVEELGLTMPVICMTGAVSYSPNGDPVRATPLDMAEARRLLSRSDREGWATRLYFVDGRIHQSRPPNDYESRPGAAYPAQNYAGALLPFLDAGEPPIQMVMVGHRSVEGALGLLAELPGITHTTYERGSQASRTHLMRTGCSKGAALEQFCLERSIPREAVIAMGDGMADLSMIRWAGTGVAMPWSPDEVRAGADMVVESGTAHPVAVALRQLLD